jgi:hypothetical protein
MRTLLGQGLVLRLVPRANEYRLPRFFIVNDVLSRLCLAKCSYKFLRIVEGLHCLDEMEASIVLHFLGQSSNSPCMSLARPQNL